MWGVFLAMVGLVVVLVRAPTLVGDMRLPLATPTDAILGDGGGQVTVGGTAACARVDEETGTLLASSVALRVRVTQDAGGRSAAAEGEANLACLQNAQPWTVVARTAGPRLAVGPARVCVTLQRPRGTPRTACKDVALRPPDDRT